MMLVEMAPTRQVLSTVEGLEFTIDSRCCGMAGNCSYEQGHYQVAQACEDRALAVRGTVTTT
jgi:Fe-S oxidoreductase